MALKNGMLPMYIHSDCMMVIDGINNGKQWCLHPTRLNVDLWRLLWHALEDHGGVSEDLTFTYVKAHQTVEESFSRFGKKGNDWADVAAKKGLAKHAISPAAVSCHEKCLEKVRQIASWIGNTQQLVEERSPDRQQPMSRRLRDQTKRRRQRRFEAREATAGKKPAPRAPPLDVRQRLHEPMMKMNYGSVDIVRGLLGPELDFQE